MNSLIRDELLLMMNVFGNICDNDQIKIISACSKILDNETYITLAKGKVDKILNTPDFDITSDFSSLIFSLIELNSNFDFYKTLNCERMRVILYGILYALLTKSESNALSKIEINKLRIIYYNSVQLILLDPQQIVMKKETVSGCIGRWFGWNSLVAGRKLI